MTGQRWWVVVAVTGCVLASGSCAPSSADTHEQLAAWDEAPDLDAAQRAEIRQAFDDATCFCLGHLGTFIPSGDVDDPLLLDFRAGESGRMHASDGSECAVSTASPRGARPEPTRRLGGANDMTAQLVNACVHSRSLATTLTGGVLKGLCQAELNYCIGNELRLKAASLSHAPSSVEVQDWIRTVAHERFGAAAIEYIGSLEAYTEYCAAPTPLPRHVTMCERLESPRLAEVISWRMSDALSQVVDLVDEEAQSAMARGDAIAPSSTLGELDYLTRVWGVGNRGPGARLQAAERIYGPFDHGATWSLETSTILEVDRAELDHPVASHIHRDRHANRMLGLLQRFQVPFAHGTVTHGGSGYPEVVAFEADDPQFVGNLYRFLDHRMAAAAYLQNYGAPDVDLSVCTADNPEPPPHCSPANWPGASLRAFEPIDEDTFEEGLVDLPPDVSPLRRLGLTHDHLRDALGLGYDQLTTLSPTYDTSAQITAERTSFDITYDAVHVRSLQQRPPLLLSAALSLYGPASFGRSNPTPELDPHPSLRIDTGVIPGTDGYGHYSILAERLPLIYQEPVYDRITGAGATEVRDTYSPGPDDENYYALRPERLHAIGAAGTLQIARVYLLRLLGTSESLVDAQSANAALALVDGAIGGYWTEYNRQVQNPCVDVAFDGSWNSTTMMWQLPGGYSLCGSPTAAWDYFAVNPGVCTDRLRMESQCQTNFGCAFDTATDACTDDRRGFWRVYFERGRRDTQMFAAGEPVVVRTMAEARCLLSGRVCEGTSPTVLSCDPVQLEDAPILDPLARLTPAQRLGRDVLTCRPPDGDTFTAPSDESALATSRLFVFWRRQVEGDVYSYELIDVIRPAVYNEVHALGGEFANVMSDVLARDPLNPGRPAISSIGFDYDFVPPLENELTDDGDAIEDSWDRYLTDAETAATRAATLLADARAAESDAVRNRITDRIAEDVAELAQREVVSEICGTSSSAACEVPREAEVTLGELQMMPPNPALTSEPEGPLGAPVSEGGYGGVIPCAALTVETMARNFRIDGNNPEDWATYVENYLTASLACAYWNVLTAADDVVIHDLPTRVRDELISNGDGNFADVDGSTREEFASLYANLITIRQSLRSFHDEYSVARVQIANAAQDIRAALASNDELWCKVGMVVGAVVAVVVSVVALVVSFGTAAVGSALLAAGAVAATVAGFDECDAHYRRGEQRAGGAVVEAAASMSRLEGYLYVAQGAVTASAIADSRLDRAARRVEIAEARRALAIHGTSVDALSDMPEWQVLQDVRLRRAREAVRRAQQASWIARRAIEYRFASDMSLMPFDERFTPAPSSWVNDIFTIGSSAEGTSSARVYVNTAAEALQDHVRSLRDFVRGYSFTHRFQEGTDFVVLDLAQLGASTGAAEDELGVPVPFATTLQFRCPGVEDLLPLTATGAVPCVNPEWAELAFEVSPSRGTYIRDRLAVGNVNYRTESLSLNIVGSGVLNCSLAARPSECYGDSNIPFELTHHGEVLLENVDGELHAFVVDPATIRGGRAIASERVLTNPLLAPDRALVSDFSRAELRGRPVDGQYVLRIYGRPEIVWTGIEGIQMALQYRYWTRQ